MGWLIAGGLFVVLILGAIGARIAVRNAIAKGLNW